MKPRNILVTGGNGGIGSAIARAFLQSEPESRVWLGVRSKRSTADDLVLSHSGRVQVLDLDVTAPQSWHSAIETMESESSPPDVLVNAAGGHQDGLLAMMTDESWRSVQSLNLDSVFYGCRAVVRGMIGLGGGRIINISSLSAMAAPIGQSNYASAKAGVIAMTESFAKEVARMGITVNCVCPGYIDTEALQQMSPAARKEAESRIPARRFGKPEEVASAVLFFASPGASYVTGSALKIDGGLF